MSEQITTVTQAVVIPNQEVKAIDTSQSTNLPEEISQNGVNPAHSPTSSLLSTGSTERLIKSLSVDALASTLDSKTGPNFKIPDGVPAGKLTPAASAKPPQTLPKSEQKPVKFTVRKVSRETINIPDKLTEPGNKSREYAYGNLPENREKTDDGKAADKATQLQHSQAKYDSYAARIEKITKEIEFLTNLLPPYNVEIDYATRTKITRAIEKLKMKQDEIGKKKYSAGITISRLWREHDENDIWVRSVR